MSSTHIPQSLIKRNPALTQEEFSHHWFTKHAPLVVPMLLHSGILHYEQIHGPLTLTNPSSTPDIDITTFSGAALILRPEALSNPTPTPKWKQDYYNDIVLADELRFLVSEAAKHYVRVDPETVKGERKVVIENGKCLIDVPGNVWEVWREYERRGGEDRLEESGK